ncbi:MAG: UDP-glucose 4-epimerase GalE [Chitinophagales bacterium]
MNGKKTILITGGCGYIGSHTAVDLLQKDYDVISIDNLSHSKQFVVDRIKAITNKEFINYRIDCRDIQKLKTVISNNPEIEGIIHFAAFKSVGESVKMPLQYYDNNLNSLINMLRIAEEFKINSFIFSSSCSVYGNTKELPVSEQTKVETPESPYGWTKLICEQILESHAKNVVTNIIALRYFNPVGAHVSGLIGEIPFGNPENLVPAVTQTAIGKREKITVHGNDYDTRDGSCIRDYIHVMDIAEAHSLALQYLLENKNESNYEVFNLGTGKGVTVLEVIQAFEKINAIKLNYIMGERRKGDVIEIYADNKKAREKLAWHCKFSLEDMMRTAWLWEQTMQKETTLS